LQAIERMPKPRKIRVEVENNEPPVVKKKNNSKETPAKKLRYEPEWMRGDGRTVVNLILSVQKSDINNVKVTAELAKLYKSVSSSFLDVY
jgi:endonuclease III